ncbi:hypothetical protein AB4Z48_22840 [Cupriavidus sp. 2TAF22]|uniref:hypothetical protein n=1 Tax=unclassified Cupriavidus TaxID=2640874 RepID=UPI003F912A15
MATQRPHGSSGTQPSTGARRPAGAQGPRPHMSHKAARPPGRESTAVRDLGPDTVWHTRGLHGHTRLRTTTARTARSPQRQLPPSRVPRLLLWTLLVLLLAVLANAVLRMTH